MSRREYCSLYLLMTSTSTVYPFSARIRTNGKYRTDMPFRRAGYNRVLTRIKIERFVLFADIPEHQATLFYSIIRDYCKFARLTVYSTLGIVIN